jgi:type I restriction enzyme M protein
LFDESESVKATLNQYTTQLNDWWKKAVPDFEALPQNNNLFELYRRFSESFTNAIAELKTGQAAVLDNYQNRGALASYWNELKTDLKSVAASGWNAELIPDDEILESQFPEVLKELHNNQARKEELEALFNEVNELEEGVWSEEDYEVWPKDELKEHKESIKALKGELKEITKEISNLNKRIIAYKKANPASCTDAIFCVSLLKTQYFASQSLQQLIISEEQRFSKHAELEEELKKCNKIIKEIKDKKQNLVDTSRDRILPEEAKKLILIRWHRTLHQTINGYLQTHQRNLLQAAGNLWDKYTTPLHSILSEREKETKLLNSFLMELGYE